MTAPRRDVDTKAGRYLVEGRVIIRQLLGGDLRASVRGEGAVYAVTHRRGSWSCNCPARTRCAHIIAVGRVTAPAERRLEVDR